jgi:hypothetical protein
MSMTVPLLMGWEAKTPRPSGCQERWKRDVLLEWDFCFAGGVVVVRENVEDYEADEQGYHGVPFGVSWTRTRPGGRVREILVVFSRGMTLCGMGVPNQRVVCDIFYSVLASRWLWGRDSMCMHVTLVGRWMTSLPSDLKCLNGTSTHFHS